MLQREGHVLYLRVCLRQLNLTFHPVDALVKGVSRLTIIMARSAIEITKVASAVRERKPPLSYAGTGILHEGHFIRIDHIWRFVLSFMLLCGSVSYFSI